MRIRYYLIIAIFFLAGQVEAQWTQSNSGLNGGGPVKALVSDGSKLLAGTRNGVFLSINNGTSWTAVSNGLANQPISSLAITGTNIFAGTENGDVFLSTNNGANWTAASTGLPSKYVYSIVATGSNVFAATDGGGIFLSTNNGANWTAVNTGLTTQRVFAMAVNGSNIFAGTDVGVFLSTNNGTSWAAVNNGLANQWIWSLAVSSGGSVFAGSETGLFVTVNNGLGWSTAHTGLPPLRVVSMVSIGANIFAAIDGRGIYISANNGVSWTDLNTGLSYLQTFVNSLAVSGSNLFAGTYGSGVLLSSDNGTSWASVNTGLISQTVQSFATTGSKVLVGTEGGGFFLSGDNGATWAPSNNGLTSERVWSLTVSGTKILAGTYGDGVYSSNNSGASWTPSSTGLTSYGVLCFAVSGSNIFAGTGAGVFLSTNGGANWAAATTGLSNRVNALAISGNNIFAGTDNGVYLSTNNGTSWAPVSTGLGDLNVNALVVNGNSIFAGTYGGVFISTNNGTSWAGVANGSTNPTVNSLVISGSDIFAGTNGGVYLTSDNGVSWTNISTGLTNLNVNALAIVGSNILAGTFGSGVFIRPLSGSAAAPPTITSITPGDGPAGTTVTITGTNFDTTPANNIVKFNDITAIVTESTTTSITTSVPEGAGSGNITVTVGGQTTTSASSFVVPGSKQNQTITFDALSSKNVGDAPFQLMATASSGLPVSYSSSNTSVATISGDMVTIVGAGMTTITASQEGDNAYNTATPVANDLTVTAPGGSSGSGEQFWGATVAGGNTSTFPTGDGVIFQFDPSSKTYSKRFEFVGTTGDEAQYGLLQASNSKLYGTTRTGGTLLDQYGFNRSYGAIYEIDPVSGQYEVKYSFMGLENPVYHAGYPTSGLVQASNGKLYGTTSIGGSGPDAGPSGFPGWFEGNGGILYEYDLETGEKTDVIDFSISNETTGSGPRGDLLVASNGKIYGTNTRNGKNGGGVLYEFDPVTKQFASKVHFDGFQLFDSEAGIGEQNGGLVQAKNGKLYGTTSGYAASRNGVIFEYDIVKDQFSVKVDLPGGTDFNTPNPDGDHPNHKLLLSRDGKLWGMTTFGGKFGWGVIFQFDPETGVFKKVYDFGTDKTMAGSNVGGAPKGGLIESRAGKLYGITVNGGANLGGTIFEWDPSNNTFTIVKDLSVADGEGIHYMSMISLYTISTPIAYSATAVHGTSLVANWSSIPFASEYLLDVSVDDFATFVPGFQSVPFKGNSGLVTGLSPSTNYKFRVRAADGLKSSGYSNVISVSTNNTLDQTITFGVIPAKTLGDQPFNLSATASSNLPVEFSSTSDKISISGSKATLIKPGSVTINANQPGDATYSAAQQVSQTFCINPAKPTIAISDSNTSSPTLTSSASAGNQWFLNGTAMTGQTAQTLKVVAPGVYKVQESVDNCASEFSADMTLIITGIDSPSFGESQVFPNPTDDFLYVSTVDLRVTIDQWTLVDMTGRRDPIIWEKSGEQYKTDLGKFPSGVYILQRRSAANLVRYKIIKN